MRFIKAIAILSAAAALAGCEGGGPGNELRLDEDKTIDRGRDQKDLSQLKAGIWVDPNGCDHWIVDDGFEGYLSQRLDRKTGKPVCSGIAPPTSIVGPFKSGGGISDIF